MLPENLEFSIVHLGVNCADAAEAKACAALMEKLFGLPEGKEGKSSTFTGREIEWMKGGGFGTHGHIAIGTSDISAARAHLEANGIEFDEATAKYSADGKMTVIYAKNEIGGFAFHLLQK